MQHLKKFQMFSSLFDALLIYGGIFGPQVFHLISFGFKFFLFCSPSTLTTTQRVGNGFFPYVRRLVRFRGTCDSGHKLLLSDNTTNKVSISCTEIFYGTKNLLERCFFLLQSDRFCIWMCRDLNIHHIQLKAYCLSFTTWTNSNNIIFSRLFELDGLSRNATSKPNNRIFIVQMFVICFKADENCSMTFTLYVEKIALTCNNNRRRIFIWVEHISWLNVVGRNHSVSRRMLKEYKWKSNNNSYNFTSCIYCRWYVTCHIQFRTFYHLVPSCSKYVSNWPKWIKTIHACKCPVIFSLYFRRFCGYPTLKSWKIWWLINSSVCIRPIYIRNSRIFNHLQYSINVIRRKTSQNKQ